MRAGKAWLLIELTGKKLDVWVVSEPAITRPAGHLEQDANFHQAPDKIVRGRICRSDQLSHIDLSPENSSGLR